MSELFPCKDAPLSYDPTTREHRELDGAIVTNPATQTQRVESFCERENEIEAFCLAAAKIPGMDEVYARNRENVARHLFENYGDIV